MILIIRSPKLWFLTLCFSMVIVLANWFDARLVQIFNLTTDAGTLIYPLTFLLSDMITEVYGYKHARRAIWSGFLFNFIFVCYGLLITHLPSPPFANHNAQFDTLFGLDARVIMASLISYLCSEPCNSYLMAKLKIKTRGKLMALRFLFSTLVSAGIDSALFSFIAFSGLMSRHQLIMMILTMWLIKVLIEALGLPLSTHLTHWLKKVEQLDIYDESTRFNLFSLNDQYQSNDNQYKK